MKFYLGTHCPSHVNSVNIPWFVSVNAIKKRKAKLNGEWILDSGGFTEISKNGYYTLSEQEYLDIIEYQNPYLAFCQDWMCEPQILEKSGLSVKEHQERTIESYLSLSSFNNKIRPVLQGWEPKDYASHLKVYAKSGVNLNQLFGVGTICSRNSRPKIIKNILSIIVDFHPKIKLHGFGVKSTALVLNKDLLWSADSMAWSFEGRYADKLCHDCHLKNCANCLEYALLWRKRLLNRFKSPLNPF